ncbi:MAG: hypothetical protein HY355_04700 [Armatimonadetes bacterium]|nr:hypothetical protein [Armatimonadota bacterium]
MRGFFLVVMLVCILVAAAAYTYGSEAASPRARLLRHLLGTAVQIVAPLIAGFGCLGARRAYAPGDRERLVWTTGAVAAFAWFVGRVVFAGYQWWGGTALPSPSIADGFFVVFYLLLGLALWLEIRLVSPMVDRRIRLALLGLGVAAWAVGFSVVMAPILTSPVPMTKKALAAFYPTAAVFLIPAGLIPALSFRGGTSAYVWVAVALAAVCLAVASLGYTLLTRYDLYSDVHSINALWVAGFLLLALGGFWQQRVQEEV